MAVKPKVCDSPIPHTKTMRIGAAGLFGTMTLRRLRFVHPSLTQGRYLQTFPREV
jgi:hypothetical protein